MFLAKIVFESNQLYKELKSAQSLAQWLRKQLVEFSGGYNTVYITNKTK